VGEEQSSSLPRPKLDADLVTCNRLAQLKAVLAERDWLAAGRFTVECRAAEVSSTGPSTAALLFATLKLHHAIVV